jgi:hypothetical protein
MAGSGDDTLEAGAGNDILRGDSGSDWISLASPWGSSTTSPTGYGSDTVVLNSLVGVDTISGFDDLLVNSYATETLATGADRLQISMAGIKVGNGDRVVNDGVSLASMTDTFSSSSELVIFSSSLGANATVADNVAASIGNAHTGFAVGDQRLFVVQSEGFSSDTSAIWLFKAADSNASVSSTELTLIATVDALTQLSDYSFIA